LPEDSPGLGTDQDQGIVRILMDFRKKDKLWGELKTMRKHQPCGGIGTPSRARVIKIWLSNGWYCYRKIYLI
jgi:hypothetical protein